MCQGFAAVLDVVYQWAKFRYSENPCLPESGIRNGKPGWVGTLEIDELENLQSLKPSTRPLLASGPVRVPVLTDTSGIRLPNLADLINGGT